MTAPGEYFLVKARAALHESRYTGMMHLFAQAPDVTGVWRAGEAIGLDPDTLELLGEIDRVELKRLISLAKRDAQRQARA